MSEQLPQPDPPTRRRRTGFSLPPDHFSHPDAKWEWWYFGAWMTAVDPEPNPIPICTEMRIWQIAIGEQAAFSHLTLFSRNVVREQTSTGTANPVSACRDGVTSILYEGTGCELSALDAGRFGLKLEFEDYLVNAEITEYRPVVLYPGWTESGETTRCYSLSRLQIEGWIWKGEKKIQVEGTAWLDHAWRKVSGVRIPATRMRIQFDDAGELLIYGERREGSLFWRALLVGEEVRMIRESELQIETMGRAFSGRSTRIYTSAWRVRIESAELELEVRALYNNREWQFGEEYFWASLVYVKGMRGGVKIAGRGWAETSIGR